MFRRAKCRFCNIKQITSYTQTVQPTHNVHQRYINHHHLNTQWKNHEFYPPVSHSDFEKHTWPFAKLYILFLLHTQPNYVKSMHARLNESRKKLLLLFYGAFLWLVKDCVQSNYNNNNNTHKLERALNSHHSCTLWRQKNSENIKYPFSNGLGNWKKPQSYQEIYIWKRNFPMHLTKLPMRLSNFLITIVIKWPQTIY